MATAMWAAGPHILRAQAGDRLRIALIGCGGRGAANLKGVSSEQITAICDVDRNALDKVAAMYPQARKEVDFRRLFDHPGEFDAVVVSTTEHTHAFATLPALQLKKHVYCEKPLAYNVQETRTIREAAARAGVVTQMGTQIHASDNYRRVVELVQSGAIGKVTECHVWVARAWGWQATEAEAAEHKDIVFVQDRPTTADPVPAGVEWDLWLGPAPARPFNNVYLPGPKWYRWWDFGNGTMSDLGSHWIDLPFWALKLRAPATIEAAATARHPELAPASMRAKYEYKASGDQPELTLTWYQGDDEAGDLDQGRDPAVAERGAVRRRQGHAARGLRQARAAAGGEVQGLHAAARVDSQVDRPLRGVDQRVQDRRSHHLPFRLRRVAHGGESSRERGVPHGEEARVGRRADARHQRARSRRLFEAMVPARLEAGLSEAGRARRSAPAPRHAALSTWHGSRPAYLGSIVKCSDWFMG